MSLVDDVGGDSPGAALSQQQPNIRFTPVNKPSGGHGEAVGKTQTIMLFVVGGVSEVFICSSHHVLKLQSVFTSRVAQG